MFFFFETPEKTVFSIYCQITLRRSVAGSASYGTFHLNMNQRLS
jgi:hypothetical protein